MRVTLGLQMDATTGRLREAAQRLLDAQQRITSGKRIRSASDDVTLTGRAMNIRSALRGLAQFAENNGLAKSALESVDAAVGSVADEIKLLREAAMQAGSSTLSAEARQGIVAQIQSIRTRLLALANTRVLDRYVFSGCRTDTPPLSESGGSPPYNYQGDTGAIMIRIQPGATIQTNVTGDRLFNLGGAAAPGVRDLFTLTQNLEAAVESGDVSATSSLLDDIDANLTNVLGIRAQVGARVARTEYNADALAESTTRLQTLLSSLEDVDLPQAVVELKTRENIYQAALAVTGRIMQISLVNYIDR